MKKFAVLGVLLAAVCLLGTNACNRQGTITDASKSGPPRKVIDDAEGVGVIHSRVLRFPTGSDSMAEGEFVFKKDTAWVFLSEGRDTLWRVTKWYMKAPAGYAYPSSTDWLELSDRMLLRLTSDATRATADSILRANGFSVAYRSQLGVYQHPIYIVIIDPNAAPISDAAPIYYLGRNVPLLYIVDSLRAHSGVLVVVVPQFVVQVITAPS